MQREPDKTLNAPAGKVHFLLSCTGPSSVTRAGRGGVELVGSGGWVGEPEARQGERARPGLHDAISRRQWVDKTKTALSTPLVY